MSYAVVHMQKIKRPGVGGIQIHNQREKESKTNQDINTDLSKNNYDIHNQDHINYNHRVTQIIKQNVETNRAIRKDAVVMCNFVITSDKQFFDGLTKKEEVDFFKKSYDFFANRYGKENIVAAPVHVDEKTPHMHLSIVPVTQDKKLSAKRIFTPVELKQIQTEYPKHMQSMGFKVERGIDAEGKNKHVEIQAYKSQKIKEEVKALEDTLERLKNESKRLEKVSKALTSARKIEAKETGLTGNNVKMTKQQYYLLKDIFKSHQILKVNYAELEKTIERMKNVGVESARTEDKLKIENIGLKHQIKSYAKKLTRVTKYLENTNQLDDYADFKKRETRKEKMPSINFDKGFELER